MEQSCVVWHSSLTEADSDKLERVQKVSLRIILKDSCDSYEHALKRTELATLKARRTKLCLKFAKSSAKNTFTATMFPKNEQHLYDVRNREKYEIQFATTWRLYQSAIPYMQRLLNNET